MKHLTYYYQNKPQIVSMHWIIHEKFNLQVTSKINKLQRKKYYKLQKDE